MLQNSQQRFLCRNQYASSHAAVSSCQAKLLTPLGRPCRKRCSIERAVRLAPLGTRAVQDSWVGVPKRHLIFFYRKCRKYSEPENFNPTGSSVSGKF